MKLQSIKINNFLGIESLEMDLSKAPIHVIAGENEAGKSSIRDAFVYALTGQARGLKTHQEQSFLIKEGAKVAEVTVALADGHAFTRRKTQKTAAVVMGDIPKTELDPAILCDPLTFLSLPEDKRREILFRITPGLSPTEQNVYERLIRWPAVEAIPYESDLAVSPNGIIKPIAKMAASHGFPGVEKECVAKRREAKRVRDEYKGATEPEKTLTIDGQDFDIPTLNLPAIEATLKELQKEKDGLLRQKGAGEARVKRLATIQGQLEKLGTLTLPPAEDFIQQLRQDLQDGQSAMTVIMEEIKQSTVEEQFFPAICPVITLMEMACPKAGIRVGQTPQKPGVIDSLKQNQQGLNKTLDEISDKLAKAKWQVDEYQALMVRKVALEEELTRLSAESEAVGTDYDTEIATRQRRIDRGQAFNRAVENYNVMLQYYESTQVSLAAAEQEVIIYDALQKALAPDGIPSQMIAEALDGINELLEEAAGYFFPGRYLHLTGDLGIVLQNSPYITLSKSAKYRVGVAFQYALAKLTGARILLIDEADILDDDRQGDLIKFLLAKVADFDQIMVFMTTAEPPKFTMGDGKLQTWWLENGNVSVVEGK